MRHGYISADVLLFLKVVHASANTFHSLYVDFGSISYLLYNFYFLMVIFNMLLGMTTSVWSLWDISFCMHDTLREFIWNRTNMAIL